METHQIPRPSRVNGSYVVAGVAALTVCVVGAMMWYVQPRPAGVLAPIIQTSTGPMHLIQPGRFTHGPDREVAIVPAFYMDRYEVSNAYYRQFCEATGRPLPEGASRNEPNLPVTGVSFLDATAFSKWAGKRLPDALEWEKGATGSEGFKYPWGEQADAAKANVSDNPTLTEHKLQPVDSFQEGLSPFQLHHTSGNVAEFVRNQTTPDLSDADRYRPLLDPPPRNGEPWYSVKGGSFLTPLSAALPSQWRAVPVRFASQEIGFRCVKDIAR